MELVFGTTNYGGQERECLKTVSGDGKILSGFQELRREYADCVITDNFQIVEHYASFADDLGRIYNLYIIDRHYRYVDRVKVVEKAVEETAATSNITFVTLAESGAIDAVTAGEHVKIFEEWHAGATYTAGQLRRYGEKLYKCITTHTSQADWTPDVAVSLWTLAADPAEEYPEWSQPVGAHDAYAEGAKVSRNGKKWTSDLDGNVWEPGVYGWTEVVE